VAVDQQPLNLRGVHLGYFTASVYKVVLKKSNPPKKMSIDPLLLPTYKKQVVGFVGQLAL
jgi:hypothetical protein